MWVCVWSLLSMTIRYRVKHLTVLLYNVVVFVLCGHCAHSRICEKFFQVTDEAQVAATSHSKLGSKNTTAFVTGVCVFDAFKILFKLSKFPMRRLHEYPIFIIYWILYGLNEIVKLNVVFLSPRIIQIRYILHKIIHT